MTQKTQLAATVILLRPAEPRGFEVFLVRRPDGLVLPRAMYGFPGCTMRKEDHAQVMLRQTAGLTAHQAQKIIGADCAPRQALGLWIAAIRGLFEETGVLLAVGAPGKALATDAEFHNRLAQNRSRLLQNQLSFCALLAAEDIFCDLLALAHFSNWQTPAQAAMCRDTHFFLASLPAGQRALPNSASHGLWLAPDGALRRFGETELPISFPTFASLRTLADFECLDGLRKEFGAIS